MGDYYKEKLKVDLDLFKFFGSLAIIIVGGLVTFNRSNGFGENEIDYFYLASGIVFAILFVFLAIRSYFDVVKNLKNLK